MNKATRDSLLLAEVAAFDSAWSERRWMDAAKSRMSGLFFRAEAALSESGYMISAKKEPEDTVVSLSLNFENLHLLVSVCRKLVESRGDDTPALTLVASECFVALEAIQAVLEGYDSESEDEGVRTAKLILLGSQMGILHNILAQWETGLIDRAAQNAWKLYRQGEGRRSSIASWESNFLPEAERYCDGKDRVTLAELVRLAKAWSEAERVAGRNPGIPATEDGIDKGIKRMEKRGLMIPGRARARGD